MPDLPYHRVLDVRLARLLGWKMISTFPQGDTVHVTGVPPGAAFGKAVPAYTADPFLYHPLADRHGLFPTKRTEGWVIPTVEQAKADLFGDSFKDLPHFEDVGIAIVELILQKNAAVKKP